MKPILAFLLVPLFGLMLAGVASAAEQTKSGAGTESKGAMEKKPEPAKSHQLTGEITSLDSKAGSLTVKGQAGEKNFTAEDKAKAALDKHKVGDRVKVTYVEKGGKYHARSISDAKPAAKASGEPKSSAPAKKESSKPATK